MGIIVEYAIAVEGLNGGMRGVFSHLRAANSRQVG